MTTIAPRTPAAPPLAARLADVRARIAAACRRAGRDPGEVTLVAVTKTIGIEQIRQLAELGIEDVGENRVDALVEKRGAAQALGLKLRWHMIGHWQTNKVRRALRSVDVLHSLDRDSLLEALARHLPERGAALPTFIQVNTSGETSKGGYGPDEALRAIERARGPAGLAVRGFMTMAPSSDDVRSVRPVFRRLRELRDEAHARGYLDGLDLSMGMTQDFEVAVEEGATFVRVGSALFPDARS